MRLGRRHADAVPYLAVGAAVGILVGAAVTIAIVLIVDGAGDEPAPK